MANSQNEFKTGRRNIMKMLALGSAGLLASPFVKAAAPVAAQSYKAGMPPVKIKSVKAITTAPEGSNLIVVKIETTEPGLYGLGCATFTQRAAVVVTVSALGYKRQTGQHARLSVTGREKQVCRRLL